MSRKTPGPSSAMTRRQLLLRLAALGLAAPIASACTPAAPTAAPTAAPKPAEAPKPAAPAPAPTKAPAAEPAKATAAPAKTGPEPKRGGIFVFAMPANPSGGFDAPTTTDAVTHNMVRHVCDYLVELDEQGKVIPSLAKSWSFPSDRTLVLSLREGVKFHDGAAWDAEAAKLNLDRLIAGKMAVSDVVAPYVASAEVVDPLTLRLNLKVPFVGVIRHLSHRGLAMYSPKPFKENQTDALKQRPIGTGPFLFREFRQNDSLVLEANPDHWRGRPFLDRAIFRIVPEPSARVLMLKTREAHAASVIPPAHAVQLRQEQGIELITMPSDRTVVFGFNTLKKPLDDKRVRQALAHAMNLQPVYDNLLLKFSPLGDSIMAPKTFGYKSTRRYEYNPAKARELLAQAGHPQGFKFRLTAPKGRYPADFEIAQALQADFKAIGVEMEIQVIDGGAFLTYLTTTPDKAEYESFMLGNAATTGDAQQFLVSFYASSGTGAGSNRSFYGNKDVDALLDKAAATADEGQRLQLYARAQEILMEDLPAIPLYYEGIIAAQRREVHGLRVYSNLQYDVRQAWLE